MKVKNRHSDEARILAHVRASKARMDVDDWIVSTSVKPFSNAPLKCTDAFA